MDNALALSMPDYRFKIPWQLRTALWGGAVFAALCVIFLREHRLLVGYALLVPALLLAGAGMMLFLISDPKRRTAACIRMVASVAWSGAEQVLDVGCGNGLVLLTAAKHLHAHKGKATGIDIWHAIAGRQSLEKLRRNAEIENVVDRIESREADARQMPFDNGAFDVVCASLSLHHAGNRADRTRVLAEMERVLKPGGVILAYDMFPVTNEAAGTLRHLGVTEIEYLSGLLLRVLRARTLQETKCAGDLPAQA